MVVPLVMQILFWVGVTFCIVIGMFEIVGGAFLNSGGTSVLLGFPTLLLGPVFVRLWCEFFIVIFRINETLTDIRNELKEAAAEN